MNQPSIAQPTLAELLAPERNGFALLRLAMATAVLASHSFFFSSGDALSEPLVGVTGHSLGEHAVQVFFILSGMLVTASCLKARGVADFAAGRIARVMPGLIVCVLVTALVLGPAVSSSGLRGYFTDGDVARYIVRTALLITGSATLPGVFADLPAAGLVNMSLWTLKYEMVCYGGLALVAASGVVRPRTLQSAATMLAGALAVVFLEVPSETYTAGQNVRYFALFFGMGALAAMLADHIRVRALPVLALFTIAAACRGTALFELTTALALTAATVYAGSFRYGRIGRLAQTHDLSFGVYLYAAPIGQILVLAIPGIGPLALIVLSLPLAYAAATLSWLMVERPAMALRRPMATAFRALAAGRHAAQPNLS